MVTVQSTLCRMCVCMCAYAHMSQVLVYGDCAVNPMSDVCVYVCLCPHVTGASIR